ncbi:hypothetical protein [Maritalea sp.]|uniref:hypothetical protein n=1 Tax=Maritalea sp. TaxID=2003361 RepID=UPI003EFA19A5
MNWDSFRKSPFARRWISWAAIAIIIIYLLVMTLFRSPEFDGYEWAQVVNVFPSNSELSASPTLLVDTASGNLARVRNNDQVTPIVGSTICVARQKWNFWGTLNFSHAAKQNCEA